MRPLIDELKEVFALLVLVISASVLFVAIGAGIAFVLVKPTLL